MLSLRNLARSAPRTLPRLATAASSRTPMLFGARYGPRTASIAKTFSTSFVRRQGNEELVAKLASEYEIERSSRDDESDFSAGIKQYLDESAFKVHDTPGQEEVVLSRKYNDEDIRVTFSISDLTNESLSENYPPESDTALFDEEDPSDVSAQSGGASTKGAINTGRTSGGNIRVTPEDRVAPADRPELDDEAAYDEEGEASPAFPARVNVKVTRDGKAGAVMIEATAQDGEMMIENVYYFADAAQADPQDSEAEWKRRAVYAGPPFGNLDDELQVVLERYLEDRGIDVKMANFIPEYIDHKEQKEYLRWLNNLKTFFE